MYTTLFFFLNFYSDIEAAIADSCVFMDSIVDNEDLPEVFKSDITLIPSDVTYIAGINKEAMKSVKVYVLRIITCVDGLH